MANGMRMRMIMMLAVMAVAHSAMMRMAEAASACNVDKEAMKLAPCYNAAKSEKAAVTAACCNAVRKITDLACMCQVFLSDTAKSAGINPAAALAIPKRCGFANRPVGYKCGDYTLP